MIFGVGDMLLHMMLWVKHGVMRHFIQVRKEVIKNFCKRKGVSCGVSLPACIKKKYPMPEKRYEPLAGKPSFCEKTERWLGGTKKTFGKHEWLDGAFPPVRRTPLGTQTRATS